MARITIWDGIEIRDVPLTEGRALIKADKAQDMSKEDGLSLKYRQQFTGYKTREVRADKNTTRTPPSQTNTENSKPKGWEHYKDQAKDDLGKVRISQAQVEDWMNERGYS